MANIITRGATAVWDSITEAARAVDGKFTKWKVYTHPWSPLNGVKINFQTTVGGIAAITLAKAYMVSGSKERGNYLTSRVGGMPSELTFFDAVPQKSRCFNPFSWCYCAVAGLKQLLFTAFDYCEAKNIGSGKNTSTVVIGLKWLVGLALYIPEVVCRGLTAVTDPIFTTIGDAISPTKSNNTATEPLINRKSANKSVSEPTPAPTKQAAPLQTVVAQKTVKVEPAPVDAEQPKKPFLSRTWNAIKEHPFKTIATAIGVVVGFKVIAPVAAVAGIAMGTKAVLTSAGLITAKLAAAAGGGITAEKIAARVEAAKATAKADKAAETTGSKAPLIRRPSNDEYAVLKAALEKQKANTLTALDAEPQTPSLRR